MLEFWFIVRESNFIVTPKTPEMCRVSYTKNRVKYTVFGVAYTLLELALTVAAPGTPCPIKKLLSWATDLMRQAATVAHLIVLVISNILELQDEPSSSFPLAPHHKD